MQRTRKHLRKTKKERKTKARKTKARKTKARERMSKKERKHSRKKAKGLREDMNRTSLILNRLTSVPDINRNIAQRVKKNMATKKIKNVQANYKSKQDLKRDFLQYDYDYQDPNEYDPTDQDLAQLATRASNILTKHDSKSTFWTEILGKIYIGLKEYQYAGDPRQFYAITESAFETLAKIMLNYNFKKHPDYLRSEILYEKLVVPILGEPENM
jgi:hypothetical protein